VNREAAVLRVMLSVGVLGAALALAATGLVHRAARPDPVAAATAQTQAAPAPNDMPGRVVLTADAAGHYRTEATIDGRLLDILVDTGATAVVLRYEDAETLGLAGTDADYDVAVRTANGLARARRVTLSSIAIGDITLYDVPALVAPRAALSENLLGMSALGRLHSFAARDHRLILEN
jgi:aspartyl protease family protein